MENFKTNKVLEISTNLKNFQIDISAKACQDNLADWSMENI